MINYMRSTVAYNECKATCCTSLKMPWFVKTFNETVNDNIELNTCGLVYRTFL